MPAPIGNQNAKQAKIWQQAIKRAVARRANGTIDSGLDELADKLIALVATGDLPALKELGDRLDGKPHQSVALDGDGEGGPLNIIQRVERVIVRANPEPKDG